MKAARLVVLGVALAAGGIAAYLAAGSTRRRAAAAAAGRRRSQPSTCWSPRTISAAATVIAEGDVGWQTWPAAAANANFIKKTDRPDAINDFVGAIVRVSMVAGEPIRDPFVVLAKGSGFMAAVLPQGHARGGDRHFAGNRRRRLHPARRSRRRRADAARQGGGKGRPASRSIVSDTILRNVRVLAVDQTVEEKDGTENRDRQDRDARIDAAAGRDAGAVASARHALARRYAASSIRNVDAGGRRRRRQRSAAINTVRFGVSTLWHRH